MQEHVLAGGQICPDALRMRWRGFERSGAADAGVIAVDHGEDLHPADIASFEHPARRSDVREDAALARGNDHELEILGALFVDAARKRRSGRPA